MIDTENEMVPAVPVAPGPRRRPPLWALLLAAIGLVVPIAVLLGSLVPATSVPGVTRPYAIVPSEAMRVSPRIAVTAVPRYDALGQFFFVTVREPQLDTLAWWVGRGEQPVVRGLTPREKFGSFTPSQERQRNRLLMAGAKYTAQYVALTKLGYDVEVVLGEAVVDRLLCLATDATGQCTQRPPADEFLDPDDHVVAVDGRTIDAVDDITAALEGRSPGDVVPVTVERAEVGTLEFDVELIASPDDPDRTIIGFVPFDTSSVVLPFDVAIDTDSIGGPSAGLAFTLALLDELTPGELTGGRDVAVTGTIRADGSVGAIGGLVQKAEAVAQAGAEVFIVPEAQGEDNIAAARRVAGDQLRIVPVANLDEALAALAELGGNGLDLGTPGAAG